MRYGGKQLKFRTVKELQDKIDAYFESCFRTIVNKETQETERVNIRPLTVTGLALALETTRQTLLEYQGEVEGRDDKDPGYADSIKKAKQIIENFAEEKLMERGSNTIGVIFNMKNNWGWKDKTEVEYKEPAKKLSLDEIDRLENKDSNNDE